MKKATKKQCKEFESMIKNAKKDKQIGKHGLIGNTGLGVGGFFHVSMPYDSNGKVFVVVKSKEKLPSGKFYTHESWKRVDIKKAKEGNIIRCAFCNNPAVKLDHLWPYYCEMNACKKHLDDFKKYLDKKEFPEKGETGEMCKDV